MGILSLLPTSLSLLEKWLTRIFLLTALLILLPWLTLLLYDLILYIMRAIAHEIPIWGGRARGQTRPRAPSLTEGPGGRLRRFSVGVGHRGASGNVSKKGELGTGVGVVGGVGLGVGAGSGAATAAATAGLRERERGG